MFFISNHKKRVKQLIILASVLVLVIGLAIFYLLSQKPKVSPEEKELKELIFKVEKLMELPQDETPTVATVLDEEKVREEVFFKQAKSGDKLLAYIKNKKAILYRPSANKIIEVAPISFETEK
ncbi:MAG: hypothetical protein ACOYL8_04680 [Patescibacteria group bacterium]